MNMEANHGYIETIWNSNVPIIVSNSDGRIIDSNDSSVHLLSADKTLTGKSIQIFDASVNEIKIHLNKVQVSGSDIKNIKIKDLSGNKLWLNFHSFIDKDGNVISILSDRTELTRKIKNLEEKEAILDIAIGTANIGIWSYNLGSDDLIWDNNMFLMYQIEESEFKNNLDFWMNLLSEEDAEITRKRFKDSIKNLKDLKTSFRIKTKDSDIKYIEIRGEVVREGGKAIRVTGINQDITDKFQHEQKLMDTMQKLEENNRLKTAFLQNISHEIRTPLNGIIGFSKLLIGDSFDEEEKVEFINLITSSSVRLLDVVDNIIDLSKVETNQIDLDIKEFSANALVEDLYIFFRNNFNKEDIKFNYHIDINYDVEITSDPKILNKIILHLLSNALKFTHEGEINFGYELKDNKCVFFVEDTGIGISAKDKEKIFESFVQGDNRINRDYEGAGLGLTISQQFINLLGGKIWFESEPGVGSKFFISIPSKNNEIEKEPEEKQVVNKVLVVEDDNAKLYTT